MAIVQAPYIPRSAGYGRASLAHDELASTRTMFAIGPMTQGFTAVAVLQLQETGKLDVHDPIDKHLCGLPPPGARSPSSTCCSTPRAFPTTAPPAPSRRAIPTCRPSCSGWSPLPLQFQPGTEVRQSATNFALLGMIVERASGMSYHDFVLAQQIEPLGLRATKFVEDFKAKAHRPSGAGQEAAHALHLGSAVHQPDRARDRLSRQAVRPGRGRSAATANLFAFASRGRRPRTSAPGTWRWPAASWSSSRRTAR